MVTVEWRAFARRFLVGLAVLVLVGMTVWSARGLSVNGSVNVTVDVEANNTNTTVAYPGGNLTLDATVNGSTMVNFSLAVPLVNQTFTLPSNTTYNLSGAFDTLQLICSAPTSFPSCNVTAALSAGQVFSQVDGVCNVQASCTPATVLLANGTACPAAGNVTVVEQNQTNLTVTQTLTISKENNLLTLSLANFSATIDENLINASENIGIPYTCPVGLQNISGAVDAQELFNVCAAYEPIFIPLLNSTMTRCFDGFDGYRDYVNQQHNETIADNQALSDCKASSGQKDGTITSQNAQIADLNGIISSDQEHEEIYLIWGIVSSVLIIALIGLCFMLWHKASQE